MSLLESLSNQVLPTKKEETYRYFNIEKILQTDYKLLTHKSTKFTSDENLKIINGQIASAPSVVKYNSSSKIENHFDKIYTINHNLVKNVIEINIDKSCHLNISHIFNKKNTISAYRIVINIAKDIEVELYEELSNISNTIAFYGYDINIEENSKLIWVNHLSMIDDKFKGVKSNYIKLNKSSILDLSLFDFGESSLLNTFKIDLYDETTLNLDQLVFTKNRAIRGTITQINHLGKNATTNQNAKYILQDESRAIFDGVIKVEKKGVGAKAFQNAKAMLLNDGAFMISKPNLEIYIDELEASHGSTTGELDEKQLFYLTSRGISKENAKEILIVAFAEEIIANVKEQTERLKIECSFNNIFKGE